MNARRYNRLLLPCMLAALIGTDAHADDTVATVGSIVENNGLARSTMLLVRSPSILRVHRSLMLDTDARGSADNYEALLPLHMDPATRVDVMNLMAEQHLLAAARRPEDARDELQKADAIYRALLGELPDDPSGATTLYRLARVDELLGQSGAAADALTRIADHYPADALVGDAAFRAAQTRYEQTQYAEAGRLYAVALAKGGAALELPAHYMLAWSDYKQGQSAEALHQVLSLLDQSLPAGVQTDPQAALAKVPAARAEMVSDSVRLANIAFMARGGADPVGSYLDASGLHPRYETMLYAAFQQTLLDRQRYTDAASLDAAFVTRNADDAMAPRFAQWQIAALAKGGFTQQEADAKRQFVARFEPGAPYWKGKAPIPEVLLAVRRQLGDLASYAHAEAQAVPASSATQRAQAFAVAVETYQLLLKDFPQDADREATEFSLADTLLEAGQLNEAATAYHEVAFDFAPNPVAARAGFAELQTWHQLAADASGDARHGALLHAIDASTAFTTRFPDHPEKHAVLVRAAQDALTLGDEARAIALATPLTSAVSITPELRRQAWTVVADANFEKQDYAAAQHAYAALLTLNAPGTAAYHDVVEYLARSLYRQGEQAMDAHDVRSAAARFEQVGIQVPGASIAAQADYDAARAYQMAGDLPAVIRVLAAYRDRHPSSPRSGDADKLLADAYEGTGQYALAIAPYRRIAADQGEPLPVRADAAWSMAISVDKTGDAAGTDAAYTGYLALNDADLGRGMQARERLADLAGARHDEVAQRHWLSSLIDADAKAGSRVGEHEHLLAAQASLALGQLDARQADSVPLGMPLNASLPRRRAALEAALHAFDQSAAFGFAEPATAATYEAGRAYQSFAEAIERISPPRGLPATDRQAWQGALDKEAAPFLDKARAAYETDLAHAREGIWNAALAASAQHLASLDPITYGKNDERAENDPDWR